MDVPGSLGPDQRRDALRRLRHDHLDVLVIGGGVTGVGCALDAAARGLAVGLVEQRDLASGTSSRSSKLIHGGLRYLEQRDFALVKEALRERGLLMGSLCPHLVRPVRFLLPLPKGLWSRLYYGAGVLLYDLLAMAGRTSSVPMHRHLTKSSALKLAPGLDPGALTGAIVYSDAQVDDARHTLAVARTASHFGAAIALSVRVTDLIVEADRVVGAELFDVETGEHFTTRARTVVNATGVWSEGVEEQAAVSGAAIRTAKGVHLVVAGRCIDADVALILRTPVSVLLVIPWGDDWLIGTTDTAWEGDLDEPGASRADIDYLIEQANAALKRPLSVDDVISVYAGLRPLVDAKASASAKLSREHAVIEPMDGLVTIAGGKYTTYRVMAADTIDAAADAIDGQVPASPTGDIPLIGADAWSTWKTLGPELAGTYDLPEPVVERLLWRHGSRVTDVLGLIDEDERLAELLPGGGYLAAEVVYAGRHEGALHLDDVLSRRLRMSMETADRAMEAAPAVSELLGVELGWSEERRAAEIAAWRDRVAAERAAGHARTDEEADGIMRTVVDVRSLAGQRFT